jgi:hypothetical protein
LFLRLGSFSLKFSLCIVDVLHSDNFRLGETGEFTPQNLLSGHRFTQLPVEGGGGDGGGAKRREDRMEGEGDVAKSSTVVALFT